MKIESLDRMSSVWPVRIASSEAGASLWNQVVLPMFCGPTKVRMPWLAMPSGLNAAATAWIIHLRMRRFFIPAPLLTFTVA